MVAELSAPVPCIRSLRLAVGITRVQSNCHCSKHGPNLRPRFGHRRSAACQRSWWRRCRVCGQFGRHTWYSNDAQDTSVVWWNDLMVWIYEDLIDDWLGITTSTPRKHGPSLKNSLVGSAAFYKNMFDNTLLRDADQGLNHFKTVFVLILSKEFNMCSYGDFCNCSGHIEEIQNLYIGSESLRLQWNVWRTPGWIY